MQFIAHPDDIMAMIQQLKWETLEQRRLKARVVMGYRVVNDLVKIPKDQLIPNKSSTREHHMKYHTIYAKRNYYKYTFFPTVIPLWNSLPGISSIDSHDRYLQGQAGCCNPEETLLNQDLLFNLLTIYRYLCRLYFSPPSYSFTKLLTCN